MQIPTLGVQFTSAIYVYDDILVAPVYTQIDGSGHSAPYPVWLPNDTEWFPLYNTSVPVPSTNSSGWASVSPLLYQVPTFAKAGSMIPMLPDHVSIVSGVASRSFSQLEWWVFPTSPRVSSLTKTSWCYEDDGMSLDYIRLGKYVNMSITKMVDVSLKGLKNMF